MGANPSLISVPSLPDYYGQMVSTTGGRRTDTIELNRVISHQREVDTPEIEL